MSLVISEDKELVLELIILLFQRKKISIGKASELAKCHYYNFRYYQKIQALGYPLVIDNWRE